MNIYVITIVLGFLNNCVCDFYAGMFKENDFLVAQDRLYKERVPYRSVYAKYGRIFQCPITYYRIVDRLGIGRGPGVEIIRGGIRHKYLVLRLKSPYNKPISANIYVGCENKSPTRTDPHSSTKSTISSAQSTTKPTMSSAQSTIKSTMSSAHSTIKSTMSVEHSTTKSATSDENSSKTSSNGEATTQATTSAVEATTASQ